MATVLLSAAGAAIGGAVGGGIAGLSSVVIGRAVGATLGRAIDSRVMGSGSDPVAVGRVSRFRLTSASEGEPMTRLYGRSRLPGQVIWASQFRESTTTTGGGKGGPPKPQTTQYSYSVSLAIALCEGKILSVPRLWADGEELGVAELNMTVHRGTADQQPDSLIEAVEGAGEVPAYRGTAYVVIEDLELARFGNRVPQFSFEVLRGVQPDVAEDADDPTQLLRGVALIPGTGEYALAEPPLFYQGGPGERRAANAHAPGGQSDLRAALTALGEELPHVDAVSLVVSWFGTDLRCGDCTLHPRVEQKQAEVPELPWRVAGLSRETAGRVLVDAEGRPVYGGTPSDQSVIQSIRLMRAEGKRVMFYPFILMEQSWNNSLPDPYGAGDSQPQLPWRGRITLSRAPGQAGSPDGTADAATEVAQFMGTARAADFTIAGDQVAYTGDPEDWGLRRFILHYAALCAAAGGVDAFCISSEMRGLTQIRDDAGFPAVQALRDLAAEARVLLGAETRISYAADWSEYWGHTTPEGDRYFHLDPLWSDPEIDFVGIDNYMPLADWREGVKHLDHVAGYDSTYDLSYLRANIEGGEGFDWYYQSDRARAAQIRTPIRDDAEGEHWIWRYKDLRNWWLNAHHERINGQRQAQPTAWEPQSKPIWFTEFGCPAVDKGANQPNVFLDPKSSESFLPHHSNGARDDLMQLHYHRAMLGYWTADENNPRSDLYDGQMIDMGHAFAWTWDARPFPAFPAREEIWSDGENYLRGHWLNGRVGQRTLASVVMEICLASGLTAEDVDVSELTGIVHGYDHAATDDGRAALQPLMLCHGFDGFEQGGVLRFRMRGAQGDHQINPERLVVGPEMVQGLEHSREAESEMMGRVRLRFQSWGGNYDLATQDMVLPDEETQAISDTGFSMVLTSAEGRGVVARWLAEARLARDTLRLSLPLSQSAIAPGDVLELPVMGQPETGTQALGLYRVDRIDAGEALMIEAVRVDPSAYLTADQAETLPNGTGFTAPGPVLPLFLDLPLLTGDELPHAPHLAVAATPWPGQVAVYASDSENDFAPEMTVERSAALGQLETPLGAGPVGRWDLGARVQVRLPSGLVQSRDALAVLNGANVLAIGDGSPDNWEVLQFQHAELIAPGSYILSGLLRGQQGSDGKMPDIWPVGSYVVVLDRALPQLPLSPGQRRRSRSYRIGPAARPFDDPAYVAIRAAFEGVGLRPYAPVHLRQSRGPGEDVTVTWIRRTRIEGDSWDLEEVPLGEAEERYRLRVMRGDQVLREAILNQPRWTYGAADQARDAVQATDQIEVAQISDRYGAGTAARVFLGD